MPDKSKKIFISYGSKDHAYAKKIEDFLNKKGHKVWRDENKLSNAILWNQDIVEAINQNDCALLLWSSYAETRETIRQEIMTARALQKPIVIVLVPYEDHLPELPNVLRTIQAIRGKNDNQILEKILDRINDDQLKKVQYPLLTENLHIPNFRNEFFIGRENELSKLFFDLWGPLGKSSRNAPMVIRGMAGIGKTELANELAYRINIFYPGGVYWIDASGNHLEAKFAELAIELNLVTLEQAEHKLLAKQAINYLSKHNDILLIIDDIRNPDLLKDWLPKGARACTTLITTREFLFGYQTIELDILDEKSAFDLLVKHRRTINDKDDEIAAAKEICKLGGYHPKMLIGCAQELRTITAQDYLANMQNKTGASTRTQDIMNVSFDISYERVESSEKNDYFFLLGHFNTIEVDKEMIIYACDSPSVGMTVIQQLHDHTLISFGTSDQLIHVHPLVKDYSLFKQGYDNKDVIKRYIKVIESYVNKYADEQYIQKILSQAVNIEHAIELAKQNNILESYFNIVIYYCKHLGYQNKFDEALKYLLDLKKFIEQGEIRNKDILMNTYLELANVYYHKYEFKFSKKYYQKIYDIKTLPEPEKSDLYYGLGRIEFKEGNHDKAIQMFEKAKTILLDNCAESNPDVLKVEHAIALVEYEQNKFDDSLYRLEKIFALYDESQRLERAKILINICNGYRRQANFELAFDKINDAISILEKIYGSDHAIIADALEIKIKVLYHLSKFEEHLRLLNRILDIRQKAHTETHPAIGRTKYDFGNYYL
ncbi:MAG: TIR domain-containing protein, partial [Calditrichaeota bacterium]